MLIKQLVLQAIAEGRIKLAFRRWKRPTVKAGGRLRTSIGVLAIESVDLITERRITKQDAIQAGYPSRKELLSELNNRKEGQLYRIALRYAGTDPRGDLQQQDRLADDEITDLKNRLASMDKRSNWGPWTTTTLQLIAANPAERAPDLAESMGMETRRFKSNVRKLKELGLTVSLKVGYRLSPRGEAVYRLICS